MKPIGSGGWNLTHRPHPEEARSAVSKDGRRLGLACGRPSRRAQSFEARAPSGARAPQDDVRAPQDEVGAAFRQLSAGFVSPGSYRTHVGAPLEPVPTGYPGLGSFGQTGAVTAAADCLGSFGHDGATAVPGHVESIVVAGLDPRIHLSRALRPSSPTSRCSCSNIVFTMISPLDSFAEVGFVCGKYISLSVRFRLTDA
jgi:hypothetical protein